ncbi:BREX-5 system adenine-specific DNA-methyltransferase PglX [Salinibacter ruber]|uniref:BREX-5 system adenine-specific DNA-methyltransferase PglX n=1 Tax=Salinibacter ruber TaxID=146919 RepID=UPI002167AE8D|nr:BREX-5 system adenine-specific DNA-methyltransferase PglX [Salinibacter ruber]MCS4134311.1 type I restriction-modification system DNA methylase subunit [Salinibacter ruber]
MTEVTQQAQLDEPERRHLEKIVKQLRERAEETVEYWVHSKLNLAEEGAEAPANLSTEERELRGRVEEAIEREQAGERSWAKARDLYVKSVGYTLVNRLAALRCMEVRGFLDRSPTRFREDGVTPAADRLITDYFLPREAGIWTAFLVACQERSEEIEILFDLSDPYSLLYGDLTGWDGEPEEVAWSDDLQSSLVDLLQDLGGLLDEVEDAVWRADDVLGWVYEYYNLPELEDIAERRNLSPDEVTVANQFYTPHWVVRMLTDNSLGKLFLEHEGTLQETIQRQDDRLTPEERKTRDASEAASIGELCTYLVATEEEGEATDFDHPSEIRVFDPACGSGHFLLYAFEVLERIWWAMEPNIPRADIPSKILRHNLYGVDLDLRACQLAAFSLYLKARNRAEEHGADGFEIPALGIVCADTHVADIDYSHRVFDNLTERDSSLRDALRSILSAFEQVEGLGSLLDVKGTLAGLVDDIDGQMSIFEGSQVVELNDLLSRLHKLVAEHTNNSSFEAKDLRSFLRLLEILSQQYDVVLMNPPYGTENRMPNDVRKYVRKKYRYTTQFYINFFEQSERVTRKHGRIGMLVPHSFMFHKTFRDFREDFVGGRGGFDILAELGYGVLDNATVGTVATVIKSDKNSTYKEAKFIRLSKDDSKEKKFVDILGSEAKYRGIKRVYEKKLYDFTKIDSAPLSYWVPEEIRKVYSSSTILDAKQANLDGRNSAAEMVTGVATGVNDRFLRRFWEIDDSYENWVPYAKGGRETWMLPAVQFVVNWSNDGGEIYRYPGPTQGTNGKYFREGVTYNLMKRSGRRFGFLHKYSIYDRTGPTIFTERDEINLTGYLNSKFVTYLMLAQTVERRWYMGIVSKIPWRERLDENEKISAHTKKAISGVYALRQNNFNSPHYKGPLLLRVADAKTLNSPVHRVHPHRSLSAELDIPSPIQASQEESIQELGIRVERFRRETKKSIEAHSAEIDREIFEQFGVSVEQQREMYAEIAYRTTQDPRSTPWYDSKSVSEPPEDLSDLVKRMLLHLTFEIAEEDDDGIVLLRAESDEEEADLLAKMTAKFEDIWGEYAEDRLQEVDEVLGDREPTDEPYPNLRHWLENDLFAFHCDEFEDTPILWELTTERLGEDNGADAGFACLIDYHQLGPDVFDRLSARYLETRKAALRERQQSARRTAEGSEGTQAREARQEEKRCENALRQIDELETRISELTQTQPRDWADAVRDEARDLEPKVRRFRERLEERLETLDALHEEAPSSWFKDHFSDKFMESVGSNREEWIDALNDLEAACEQFARPADQPVEAHLYDLLPYFDDLTGSTHYSSNGIFFLNYYFSKGKDLAAKIDQGSKDRVTRREQLVADLARETDDDIELGKEVNEACQAMKKHMDSDWKPRALEEVRTPGYRPVKKHGVAINITPLAEKKLVPELVDKKVL